MLRVTLIEFSPREHDVLYTNKIPRSDSSPHLDSYGCLVSSMIDYAMTASFYEDHEARFVLISKIPRSIMPLGC